jgi:hypothetical protein
MYARAEDYAHRYGLKYRHGKYYGNCPVCEYQGFTLREQNGKLLFKSHACGCSQDELIQRFREDGLWSSSKVGFLPQKAKEPKLNVKSTSDTRDIARRIWRETVPATGTIVEAYLQSRGITCPVPEPLRFSSRCWHDNSRAKHPAMIAKVRMWNSDELIAIHRTYLEPDGSGKAAVAPNKMTLGPYQGGAVHITPASETLAIAEGLETSLAVHLLGEIATWCALSASGLKALILPPLPLARNVHIFADKDTNFVGQDAAEVAAKRWSLEGRKVKILTPKQWGTDFNDLLQRKENPHAP